MTARTSVFVSYSSSDRDFAKELALALGRHRVDVWWDQARLRIGSDLAEVITEAIATSRWFAVLLSERALESEWVEIELTQALEKEERTGSRFVLPLLIEDCALPASLTNRAHADFRTSFAEGLEKVLNEIGSPYRRKVLNGLCSESPNKIWTAWSSVEAEDRDWWVSQLVELARDRTDPRRPGAVTALRLIDPDELRNLLPALLRDGAVSVLQRAIISAGELGDRSHEATLVGLANHGNPVVRQVARQALRQLGL